MLNSKDMCLLPRLPDLLNLGMDSLKVEGRNKTEYYAAVVARTYEPSVWLLPRCTGRIRH